MAESSFRPNRRSNFFTTDFRERTGSLRFNTACGSRRAGILDLAGEDEEMGLCDKDSGLKSKYKRSVPRVLRRTMRSSVGMIGSEGDLC